MTNDTQASIGDAFNEAHDRKLMRVKTAPPQIYCPVCTMKRPESHGHSYVCRKATREDLIREVNQAREREQWARERAVQWLQAVRQMHGKLAMLKEQIRKLRRQN